MKGWKSVRDAVKIDRFARIPTLGARSIVWVVDNTVTKGECKHDVTDGSLAEDRITEIGTVISGKHAGLTSTEEITLFDGTGVVCQNLAVASDAVELALKTGDAIEIKSLSSKVFYWSS